MNYHLVLQSRVEQLVRDGREVIVLGDLNICAQPLDHCDGHLESVREGFWEHPARRWAREFFGEGGRMVDVVRMFWPDRKAMCVFLIIMIFWWMLIDITGTHVRPPLPWIEAGDIAPSVKGSDHCPIWVDLREEIEVDVGGEGVGSEGAKKIIKLRDVMRVSGSQAQPPRVAAKYWEE
jgi:AP endonuclease 2